MLAQSISPRSGRLSASQRRVQRRVRRLCFKAAVRLAADAQFRFTHRATQGKALWSDSVGVWLGNATFIHWAMGEARIDIPRIVAETDGAPESEDEFHKAVHLELMAYWADRLGFAAAEEYPGLAAVAVTWENSSAGNLHARWAGSANAPRPAILAHAGGMLERV